MAAGVTPFVMGITALAALIDRLPVAAVRGPLKQSTVSPGFQTET
jgi:hypothetical protein